jgi:regulator of extracellular matrix RemA (YlzA/DUF370 family)
MSEQRRWGVGQPVSVGFGGAVAGDRIVALANPNSAPIQRAVRQAREEGRLIDLTFGRRIRAVLFLDSGHVIRVAVSPETLFVRWSEGPHLPAPSPKIGRGGARSGAEDGGEGCLWR